MLKPGDCVATVSLSWGGAGDEEILWRYQLGKKRLESVFGLKVIEMEHTLKGTEFVYNHPELRAKDLMDAFMNPEIKGIFSCIGGDDSIRLLPYIDFEVIRTQPKVFIGYSDSTITHLMCYKAGLISYYGPSILAEFAENIQIFDYTLESVRKTLFSNEVIGEIKPSQTWTSERIKWLESNKDIQKTMVQHYGYELLQGSGIVQGKLFGGCIEVLEFVKGTELWPTLEDDLILFFETSEEQPQPDQLLYWLRNYAVTGILTQAKAILFGKPSEEKFKDEYRDVIKKVVNEFNLECPIMLDMCFGHNEPMHVIPYGVSAEVNCELKVFSILESGVE
jgi:muramoyltetrapeptide carboxypeptidase LdcA involved in peptidoglycan recycling